MSEAEEARKDLPYYLGMVFGNIIAAQKRGEVFVPRRGDEKTQEYLQKSLFHARNDLLDRVLPSVVSEKDFPRFYEGLARVLVITRTSLTGLVDIAALMPGQPWLRRAKAQNPEAIRSGRMFYDSLTKTFLEVDDQVGLLVIKCIIDQLRRIRERREAENYKNAANTSRTSPTEA